MKAPLPSPTRINVTPDAAIWFGGKVYEYRGRARDAERKLIFVAQDGLTKEFTDMDVVRLLEKTGSDGMPALRWIGTAELMSIKAEKKTNWSSLYEAADRLEKARVDSLLTFIRAWERLGKPPRTDASLRNVIAATSEAENIKRISPSSLRRAIARFDGDIDSLVSRHDLKGNHEKKADEDAMARHHEFACNRFFVDERPDVFAVHELVKQDFLDWNEALPPGAKRLSPLSLSTTYNIINAEGAFVRDFTRIGPRMAKRTHRAVGQAPETACANDVWEMDASPLPVVTLDEDSKLPIGRPTITFSLDRQSRAITGFDLSWRAESLRSVANTLRMAMQTKDELLATTGVKGEWPVFGRPGMIVADNAPHTRATSGKAFKFICERLGCVPSNTPTLKPWYKGKIERLLRTYFFKMCHVVPGSTFSDIFERSKERVPEKVAVCTLSELKYWIVRFIVEIYLPRCHRGLNDSPLRTYKASIAEFGVVPAPDSMKLTSILSVQYERTVQASGIELSGLQFNSDELMVFNNLHGMPRLIKATVNPDDVTQAWWVDPRDGSEKRMFLSEENRHRYKGWTLDRLERVRALQRNNPELLAGDEGARKAHAMYLKQILEAAGSKGLSNRLKAIRALEKLRQRARAMFNDDFEEAVGQNGDLLDDVFGDEQPQIPSASGSLSPQAPLAEPSGPGGVADAQPADKVRKPGRSRKPKKPAGAVEVEASPEPKHAAVTASAPLLEQGTTDPDSMRAFAERLVAQSRRVTR